MTVVRKDIMTYLMWETFRHHESVLLSLTGTWSVPLYRKSEALTMNLKEFRELQTMHPKEFRELQNIRQLRFPRKSDTPVTEETKFFALLVRPRQEF